MYNRKRNRGIIYFLCFLAVYAGIAVLVAQNRTSDIDKSIIDKVQSMERPVLTFLAEGLSLIGSTKIVLGLSLLTMALLYFLLKHRVELILFMWVELGSWLLNTRMKLWFQRERPSFHRLAEEAGYSFPSGHSMAAFSLYGAIAYLLWRHLPSKRARMLLIILAVFMTGGIGWSRIYLGVHYPSDVIGGYMLSAAWLILSVTLFRMYRDRKSDKQIPPAT